MPFLTHMAVAKHTDIANVFMAPNQKWVTNVRFYDVHNIGMESPFNSQMPHSLQKHNLDTFFPPNAYIFIMHLHSYQYKIENTSFGHHGYVT